MLALALFATHAAAQLGPGSGPWQVRSPASQGLNETELIAAEERVNEEIPGRVCFLVIKNGFLVHETYRRNWDQASMRDGWSTTKSHCSSLYGIAVQQGWANATELVRDRNAGVRRCNEDASFRNVLTMTGESRNIDNPQFSYDTDGTNCLDTLSDFITENNPQRLGAQQWKDRFWQDVLGMENFRWVDYLGYLHCGYTSETSCRDLARAAQLWLNEGQWPGAGQVIARDHVIEGRTNVFPTKGEEYGYTTWLDVEDPVDEEVHSFIGAYSQCAHISKKHEAIVVSMGSGDVTGARCVRAWYETRDYVVTNSLRHTLPPPMTQEEKDIAQLRAPRVSHAEILLVREYAQAHPDKLTPEELNLLNEYLVEWGERPVIHAF